MAHRNFSADKPRVNSFFAGIGGFDIAFERAGFSVGFHCEKNKFCRSVLQRHWPNTPTAMDISMLDAEDVPPAEVWAAGFPCQDLSLARTPHGRSGLGGSQSGLFFKLLELMAVHRPKVVLIENVAGLLNSHKGQDFRTLVHALIDLGYGVAWRVLNARYFGAPQSRPRVFICAWHKSPRSAAQALFEDEIAAQPENERAGFVTPCNKTTTGAIVPKVSFCISATSGRHTGLDWARSYVTYPDAVRRLTPTECERLQGFPDDWTLPSSDFKVPTRGIDAERYHAVGNAVCVPVVEWIAKRIAARIQIQMRGKSRTWSEEQLRDCALELRNPTARAFHGPSEVDFATKWKTGGIAYDGLIIDAPAATAPCHPIISRFSNVIECNEVHARYYLSPNAAQGIIRRVDKLGRSLFEPLDTSLRRLARSPAPAPSSTLEAAAA